MRTLQHYIVVPNIPPKLARLRDLSTNLWWSWAPIAGELFRRLDPGLWEEVRGNPIEMLSRVGQKRLDELAEDDSFRSHLDAAWNTFQAYLSREGWFKKKYPAAADATIAYFSMEYGLHESLPIYSGGLGVLSGDHLKTASDLGLPLVGVGLAYAEGYFRQTLGEDGWQTERYPLNDWNRLPVSPVKLPSGERLVIRTAYPGRDVFAQVWCVQVGRVPLYLLDTNIETNSPADRRITGALYGGDQEVRIRQEILLGIGGIHLLDALGISPTVCHMNEGHSAFLAIERIARAVYERKIVFSVAKEACASANVFTTHTPVPAGNDVFPWALVRSYLEPYRERLAIGDVLALGESEDEQFSMPLLAIRTSKHTNGVSELHGRVSREMYRGLWPDFDVSDVPIESITNGIHVPTWVSAEHGALYTRYLGPRWTEDASPEMWARALEIPDAEMWQTHDHRKQRLVTLCRAWSVASAEKKGLSDSTIARAEEVLDPHALTIGFARRFATYKRAALLFSDKERLLKLLHASERPLQFVFAGKAHPQDRGGKDLIREIYQISKSSEFAGRVVFIEDYDMRIARAMVSGVDVWLNNPRRPHEASGTSGMKAAANGALNLSVLDGWWAEAYESHGESVGWGIGRGEEYDGGVGDKREAEYLYDLLESEVVPLYYERNAREQFSRNWVKRMKATVAHLVPAFNTSRMVSEYADRTYVPSHHRYRAMTENDFALATDLVAWKSKIETAWPNVSVTRVDLPHADTGVIVGGRLEISANVNLAGLSPDDVEVEVCYGPTHGGFELQTTAKQNLAYVDTQGGTAIFRGTYVAGESGSHACTVRVTPSTKNASAPLDRTLVRWA
ncbi:MAG: alpha-glucan family phosphorylase [Polyangiaceae bacterium]|nr:alpha-glucan family phosphorylase [Polyangiaceae bacterium]